MINMRSGFAVLSATFLVASGGAMAEVARVGLSSLPATMDPNSKTSGPPSTIAYYPMFDALTFTGAEGAATPALATSWTAIDPLTWEFSLRTEVKFTNGEILDADDVKFTFDRVLNPDNNQVVRARIATIDRVEIVDPLTIRFITQNPDPILPKRVGSIFILPNDYFAEVGAQAFSEKPVGSGPFVLENFDPSTSATFRTVAGSWRGEPGISGIEILAISETSTRVAALTAGEIDLAESIPPDLIASVESDPNLTVVAETLGQVNLIILNTASEGPLGNPLVRQALNLAVDKDAIADSLMQGYATPTGQLVAPNGVGHDPSIKPYPYDPARAASLLVEAGYPNGFDMTLHTTQGLQLNDKEVSETVAGYLSAIGVNASIEVMETAAFVDGYHKGGMDPAFFIGWWYFPAMDGDYVLVWNESSRPQSRFKNQEFDDLYAASQAELDPAKRLNMLQEMSGLIHDEAGAIFLYHPKQTYGVNDRLKGFSPRADRIIQFDSLSFGD